MSVANQRIIQIKWREERDTDHLYTPLNIDVTFQVMEDLKYSGFKMWFYINKNQKAFKIELSQAACAMVGIKKDSYYSAVDELINKGFLVQDHYGSNMYWFYEKAVSDKPKSFSEIPIGASENQKDESENPYRNNTNNMAPYMIIKRSSLKLFTYLFS